MHSVLIPYRDRPAHLERLLPHLAAYFAEDKIDRRIKVRALVIEQANALPFNRGRLNNIGYVLARPICDYTCFHDVDYLPLWADFSYPAGPTRLIGEGAQDRPIRPGAPGTVRLDLERFFGAVVLFPNADFERINGYSNDYWGWGYEDEELRERCRIEGLTIEHRPGRFLAKDHDHAGSKPDGTPSPAHARNARLFHRRLPRLEGEHLYRRDGLANLTYRILERRSFAQAHAAGRALPVEHVKVDFAGPEQVEGL